ncbi:hypothetical protein L211DRAFT_836483 [Terfezia boudieri ATCC MYA-4762]|uniref:Uncharacterized protein n=1 Tax=Terfezia boudieri ATCC MYA-4762 TaxID=1051890 RepID=A0A3N4LQQ4_9PEZI|nr:hypothetical protein L211DRAFT_836483 [Terfezia boudieri ATCC MYA-4762]
MATLSFLTTALLLSASAVNSLAIRQPLDIPNNHQQPYATTEENHEPYDIAIVTTHSHRLPQSTSELFSHSSAQNPIQVCITVGEHQICAENPDDLCHDPVWKAMPRPENVLPWCASEGASTELKAKRLVVRQKTQGQNPPGPSIPKGLVERGNPPSGSVPGPKLP